MPALHAYFNFRLQQLLKKHGKNDDRLGRGADPSLAHDTVIQSWRGQASLAEAARKGYRGILSFGYYLDHLKPASAHYAVDPLANAPDELTQEQSSRILGGEACMWSEYVNDQTVDSRIWPRAAAIAERLWSAREVTDVESMYARLETVSRALDWVGVEHRSTYGRCSDRIAGPSDTRVSRRRFRGAGIEGCRDARKYTTRPLNRFVDAVALKVEMSAAGVAVGKVAANLTGSSNWQSWKSG